MVMVSIWLLLDRDVAKRAENIADSYHAMIAPPTVVDRLLFRRYIKESGARDFKVDLFGKKQAYSSAFESRRRSLSRQIIRTFR